MILPHSGETAMCYVGKKLSLPIKWEPEGRLELLYPLQCHKHCHSEKGPQCPPARDAFSGQGLG